VVIGVGMAIGIAVVAVVAGFFLALPVATAIERRSLAYALRVRRDYPFRCARCGAPHVLDTVVPSAAWNLAVREAHPEWAEAMLCTLCIDDLAAEAGVECDAEFYFVGTALTSRSYGAGRSFGDLEPIRAGK
jgi:hypothetical protein